MTERPNVTVIYEEARPATPGAGAVLLEVVFFGLLILGGFVVSVLW